MGSFAWLVGRGGCKRCEKYERLETRERGMRRLAKSGQGVKEELEVWREKRKIGSRGCLGEVDGRGVKDDMRDWRVERERERWRSWVRVWRRWIEELEAWRKKRKMVRRGWLGEVERLQSGERDECEKSG